MSNPGSVHGLDISSLGTDTQRVTDRITLFIVTVLLMTKFLLMEFTMKYSFFFCFAINSTLGSGTLINTHKLSVSHDEIVT